MQPHSPWMAIADVVAAPANDSAKKARRTIFRIGYSPSEVPATWQCCLPVSNSFQIARAGISDLRNLQTVTAKQQGVAFLYSRIKIQSAH